MLPFDWKRTEVWISLLLGIPSFLGSFLTGQRVLMCIILGGVGLMIYASYLFNKAEFTILKCEKTLTITNKRASVAQVARQIRAVANQKGLTELWCSGIAATGTIDEIRIDRRKPDLIEENCKQYRICKRFPLPLTRGEEFDTHISYLLKDSFPASIERFGHAPDHATRKLILRVRLPAARKCKSAKAYVCINQHPHRALPSPHVSADRREITLEITRPRQGHEYVLEWEW